MTLSLGLRPAVNIVPLRYWKVPRQQWGPDKRKGRPEQGGWGFDFPKGLSLEIINESPVNFVVVCLFVLGSHPMVLRVHSWWCWGITSGARD